MIIMNMKMGQSINRSSLPKLYWMSLMRMLETRQSRTSPSKYLIELTKEELERLFRDDTRDELVKEIVKMQEKIVPYPE